ncbi:MAG TPA: hypothetical protein VFZ40_13910 [Pyrinomonadaceae bacterium]
MKTYLFRSFVAVIVLALGTVTAFADKVKKVRLALADDVMVSGTLVKAGTYDFRFNHDTGELSILKEGKVQVKTAARLEARTDKARYTAIRTRQAGNVHEFMGLVFDGQKQELVVTSAATIR